mmetsp:Transcript_5587/g.9431  ORF Transcript_5587/g.9431 Transcript_5587/m.9431 type:complete len:213 (+) Transcript_5587:1197-1835(+)
MSPSGQTIDGTNAGDLIHTCIVNVIALYPFIHIAKKEIGCVVAVPVEVTLAGLQLVEVISRNTVGNHVTFCRNFVVTWAVILSAVPDILVYILVVVGDAGQSVIVCFVRHTAVERIVDFNISTLGAPVAPHVVPQGAGDWVDFGLIAAPCFVFVPATAHLEGATVVASDVLIVLRTSGHGHVVLNACHQRVCTVPTHHHISRRRIWADVGVL